MLDYISPFTFIFRDKHWFKKFALASLLTYTLVGGAAVMGWLLEIALQVSRGEETPLPGWGSWRSFLRPGGRLIGANVLWLVPLLPLALLLYWPLFVMDRLSTQMLLILWGLTMLAGLLFLLVYSLAYGLAFPAMWVLLVRGSSAASAASPRHLWRTIRPHFMEYVLVFLILSLGAFNIALLLAAMTLFLLFPPILVYLGLVTAHFAGQLCRRATSSGTT